MTEDKRSGWLRDLQVGDKVIVRVTPAGTSRCDRSVRTVAKITPSGRIVVGTDQFTPDGHSGKSIWQPKTLEPWTQEDDNNIRIANRHRRELATVLDANWREVSPDAISRVVGILAEDVLNAPR